MKKLLLLVFLVACASSVRAQTTNPPFDAAVAAAQAKANTGDYEAARKGLEAALPFATTSEEKARLLRGQGLTYSQEKRFELARTQWRNALALEPLTADIRYILDLLIAVSYSNEGNAAQALKELLPLLQSPGATDKEKITLRLTIATAALNAKDDVEAKRQWTAVVQSAVADAGAKIVALTQLGQLEFKQGHYPEARIAFEQLVQSQAVGIRMQAAFQGMVAQCYQRAGNAVQGREAADQARLMWLKVGKEDLAQKMWPLARSVFKEALAIEPTEALMTLRLHALTGDAFLGEGKWAQARQAYETVLGAQPDPALEANARQEFRFTQQNALLAIGASYLAEKNYLQARLSFEKLLHTHLLDANLEAASRKQLQQLDLLEKATP